MHYMKTVVIEVSGGVVQAVYGDELVRVVLVDWDDAEAGDEAAREFPLELLDSAPPETIDAVAKISA